MAGGAYPIDGLAEDLNRNGGGKGCGGSNGQLTGSNGCAMDVRNAATELGAALVISWDEKRVECTGQALRVVSVQSTGQKLMVAIAGPGMIYPECDVPMGIGTT